MLARSVIVVVLGLLFSQGHGAQVGQGRNYRSLQGSSQVTSLELILTSTNEVLGSISNNQVIYLGDLPSTSLNIDALVAGSVGSVQFEYNGNTNYKTENWAPYAMCGNAGANFNPCGILTVGSHTVTATPFAQKGASGPPGTELTVSFTIVAGSAPGPVAPPVASPVTSPIAPPTDAPVVSPVASPIASPTDAPVVTPVASPIASPTDAPVVTPVATPVAAPMAALTFTLIHAPTNVELIDITDGDIINIASLGVSPPFNIDAKKVDPAVQSVSFSNGRTEAVAPFAYCGNNGPNFNPCGDLILDTDLTVTATAFPGPFPAVTISFRLEDVPSPTTPAPVPPPISTPSGCAVPQLLGTSWENWAKYPLNVLEAQGGIMGNDLVVFSGFTNGIQSATAQNYALSLNDPSATWRPIDDLPIPQGVTHMAHAVVGTKMYLCGGYLGGHPGPHIPDCIVYDHSVAPGTTGQWSTFPPLPEGRAGGGLVYSQARNALIYAGGAERPTLGQAYSVDYEHAWMYEFDNPGWVLVEDIPFMSNHMSFVTAVDDLGAERHFFVGGQMGTNEWSGNFDDNYEWDAINETWIQRANMPFTRGHATSSTRAISCGYMIAAGSSNEFGKTTDISYYDIPSNTWTSFGQLPEAKNTPVCDIDFVNGFLYCVTPFGFSVRRPIQV